MASASMLLLVHWKMNHSDLVIYTVNGFSIVNEGDADVFLALSCLFNNPKDVGNLISASSAFSKSSLNIWEFSVEVLLLKSGLENFEHHFVSLWDECNCVVVWTFFGIALLWGWNENWPFPVLLPLLSFPNLLAYWVQWETLGWRKHKLESRLPGEISITSDMQMTPPLWQKVKK